MAKVSRKQILQDFRSRSLLESTRRLIAAEGFDAVTMARVAEEAGITKGAIYLYFRNKDQMILAAIEATAAEMVRGIERRVDPRAEPWDRLCQLIRAQLAIMEENKELLRTLLLDRRLMKGGSRSAAARRLLKYRQKHEADIRAVLEKGVRRKLFHSVEAERAACYINELTISTAQRRLLALTRSSLEQETQGLIRFVGLLLRNKNFNKGH
ncbi:MAG: TetR/AcrR family transcriptional regulator [Deltaproteobacteria bacterium]|nr:TetR/AcrR family transcriptional regulator [Deltaproteobacteria bacterium]